LSHARKTGNQSVLTSLPLRKGKLRAIAQGSVAFPLFASAYAIIWTGLGYISAWHLYAPLVHREIANHQSSSTICPPVSRGLLHYSKMTPLPADYRKLLQFDNIGVPLPIDEDLERFLKINGKFAPNRRFPPFREVRTPAQLKDRLAEIRSMDLIVVPAVVTSLTAGIDPERAAPSDSSALSGMLMFPVRLKPHKPRFDPLREIAREINANFSSIDKATDNYLILERRK
jgi:hypothetical protein